MRRRDAIRRGALAALLGTSVAVLLTACGGSAKPASTSTSTSTAPAPAAPGAAPRLSFDPGVEPLNYIDNGVVSRQGGIEMHDISYSSGGRTIAGYLVEPSGARKRPGIVLVHGSGADRSELLGDAVALARLGVVALTITEPSTAYPLPSPTTAAQLLSDSKQTTVDDVIAVRRAGDVLQSLASVDPARLGYLGWSAGAKTGAFVAASDSRFKALALLSGGADPVSAFVAAAPADLRARAKLVLGSIDPLRYLGFGRPHTILLEDGTRDSVVPHRALENFVHAAPAGTVVHWYKASHQLTAAAYTAAFAWLVARLG